MLRPRLLAVPGLAIVFLCQSCGSGTHSAPSDRFLSYEFLMQGSSLEHAVQLTEFTRPETAADAKNTFSGRLRIAAASQNNRFQMFNDDFDLADAGIPGMHYLPSLDTEFVQEDGFLIPVERGPIPSDHNWWEFVLEPGPVWDEEGDHGFSRVAIPFALKERNADCIHNGIMSFLFNDDGVVSKLVFQISHQTCMYLQFEFAGVVDVTYVRGDVLAHSAVVESFQQETRYRLPQTNIARLAKDYPGADASEFGSAEEIAAETMSVYGLLIDGKHYVSECHTPLGDYPYCDRMALPSYSTAKSLVGGLALMRAEKLYPGTANAFVSDLIPECEQGWEGVTIEHALDMATGHYKSPLSHIDEDSADASQFHVAETHASKIDFACNAFPRQSEPGDVWVYQTWATYIVGTAINARLKTIVGPDFDFYADLLVEPIWKPLVLSPMSHKTRRTYDAEAQPFTGFGLTLLRDDIAKLALFLGSSDGRIWGDEVLDRNLFNAIKQRVPGDPGLTAENENIRYNNGFRTIDVTEMLDCERPTWLTTLSGFGGINIVIMPNDTAYYYFSDGNVHRYFHAVRESHRIRPMCAK